MSCGRGGRSQPANCCHQGLQDLQTIHILQDTDRLELGQAETCLQKCIRRLLRPLLQCCPRGNACTCSCCLWRKCWGHTCGTAHPPLQTPGSTCRVLVEGTSLAKLVISMTRASDTRIHLPRSWTTPFQSSEWNHPSKVLLLPRCCQTTNGGLQIEKLGTTRCTSHLMVPVSK